MLMNRLKNNYTNNYKLLTSLFKTFSYKENIYHHRKSIIYIRGAYCKKPILLKYI